MKTGILAGSFLAGLLLGAPLNAQQASAEVVLRDGRAAGHITVHDGYSSYQRPASTYHRPSARRVVVVERHARRVIVVERVRHHGKHWRRKGYRPVVVYYIQGRYYDRPWLSRAREVLVYERDGRFYRDE